MTQHAAVAIVPSKTCCLMKFQKVLPGPLLRVPLAARSLRRDSIAAPHFLPEVKK